ncbi:MAG: MarR family winged helix-turn-helix transcriptional regulator [Acidimicrobiales bacterium]
MLAEPYPQPPPKQPPVPPPAGRIVARLARQVEMAVSDAGLSLAQYRILALVSDGTAGASKLAANLTVTRPTITALVDGLVARGMVDRVAVPEDRRRASLTMTEAGREVLARADAAATARLCEIAAHLPAEQAGAAATGLTAWLPGLEAMRLAKLAPPARPA